MSKDLSKFKGIVAVIAAAGIGKRMKADTPKQYLKIAGKTVLDITLHKLLSFEPIKMVVLVVAPEDQQYQSLEQIDNEKLVLIDGGEQRANSVFNALRFLFDCGLPDDTPVMIHDAARPCVTHQDLSLLFAAYSLKEEACLLASPVTDTLQQINSVNQIRSAVDRSKLVKALTPQMARFIELKDSLKTALKNGNLVTDEASALSAAGYTVNAVFGRNTNIKVTHPDDLALAEFYLNAEK